MLLNRGFYLKKNNHHPNPTTHLNFQENIFKNFKSAYIIVYNDFCYRYFPNPSIIVDKIKITFYTYSTCCLEFFYKLTDLISQKPYYTRTKLMRSFRRLIFMNYSTPGKSYINTHKVLRKSHEHKTTRQSKSWPEARTGTG